jgi:hypothetical protein
MHIPTRYHIRILAGLSLSLAAALVSAGEPRPYQLGDVPRHALAPVDAYVVVRLLPEEQPPAQQPKVYALLSDRPVALRRGDIRDVRAGTCNWPAFVHA